MIYSVKSICRMRMSRLLTMAENGALDEAILALEALGYSQRELTKVKPKLEKEELDTEGYMKLAFSYY